MRVEWLGYREAFSTYSLDSQYIQLSHLNVRNVRLEIDERNNEYFNIDYCVDCYSRIDTKEFLLFLPFEIEKKMLWELGRTFHVVYEREAYFVD